MRRVASIVGCLTLATLYAGAAAAQKPTNEDCLACHGDASLTRDVNGKAVSLRVDPDKFKNSTHGLVFTCVDCHTDIKTSPHENLPAKVSCATCHSEQQAAYDRSLHATLVQGSKRPAATCTDCHGSPHELLSSNDRASRTNHANIPATCGTCHNQKFVMGASGQTTQPFISYQESVHGRAVAKGAASAAVCTDCHGTHDMATAADPKSSIFKFNVPATCGKCHGPIEQEFRQSIHGQAIARGNWQAPICTDCHGIHSIRSRKDAASPASAHNSCAHCHEGVGLSQEFGFEGNRVTTYLASYHGLASRRGSTIVANCASCHGVHNILPSTDPRSSVSPANLVKTCGQCHRGATEKFVAAKVHVNAPLSADTGSIVVRWIRRFYVWLIVIVIGGMVAHNFVIWRFKAIVRRKNYGVRTVTRMDRSHRLQHAVLFISFTVLVLTGFALKFPDSWFQYLVLGISESLRGVVHRIAGVTLIASGFYHVLYLAFYRDGRRLLRDLWPSARDVADCWKNLSYYLGLTRQKPPFGRFSYAQKVEYWALVWGTVTMAVTGVMLWGKVMVGNLLPRWWLDVATAIHFYEAVLASLAILVWHFYEVFFDPDVYPTNWAWWDGQMPLDRYQEEHPLDLESVQEAGHAPPAKVETGGPAPKETESTDNNHTDQA